MKNYTAPKFNVTKFDIEDIMTSTGGLINGGGNGSTDSSTPGAPTNIAVDVINQ